MENSEIMKKAEEIILNMAALRRDKARAAAKRGNENMAHEYYAEVRRLEECKATIADQCGCWN